MNTKKGIAPIAIILIVIGVLVAGGGVYWYFVQNKPVACTQEAKLCPDGSYVGRTGPNCEFAVCPEVKADETADWKTYRNEKYGFEVRYPKEWENGGCWVDTYPPILACSGFHKLRHESGVESRVGFFAIYVYEDSFYDKIKKNFISDIYKGKYTENDVLIGNQKITEYSQIIDLTIGRSADGDIRATSTEKSFLISKNQKIYAFHILLVQEDEIETKLNQILSTFKFIK